MRFENVSIAGLGWVDAPIRVSSAEISDRLHSTFRRLHLEPGLLEGLTGVRERRFWEPGVLPSQVATAAAESALAEAGVERAEVGALINTSVCRDYIEPSVASFVHRNLGLPADCLNFDLCNACLAFADAAMVIGNMIERGQIQYGLVVDGEGSRLAIESTLARLERSDCDGDMFRAQFATLTLGSGAVAMVLSHRALRPEAPRLVGGVSLAATQHNGLCRGQREEMITDPTGLLVAGVELAQATWNKAERELGFSPDRFQGFIVHQVSAVHTQKMCESLGIDSEKVPTIFQEFGNMGPASWPTTLAKAAAGGRVNPGDRLAVMGIGSGLNCTMMELTW
ncbi:MAG: 3-oxoacyl-ACP synthase III [Myxococcota bacterium]